MSFTPSPEHSDFPPPGSGEGLSAVEHLDWRRVYDRVRRVP